VLGVAAVVAFLGACSHTSSASSGATAAPETIATSLPSPTGVRIVPPAAGLPSQLAAFSGTWEGRWHGPYGTLPSRLVVEQISVKSAQVVYVYGADPGRFPAGWMRVQATVLPSGQIRFGGESGRPTLTFTMRADGKSIAGTYRFGDYPPSTVTMTKVR
jgi:hypothetical protein